jgi:hypothetical protein
VDVAVGEVWEQLSLVDPPQRLEDVLAHALREDEGRSYLAVESPADATVAEGLGHWAWERVYDRELLPAIDEDFEFVLLAEEAAHSTRVRVQDADGVPPMELEGFLCLLLEDLASAIAHAHSQRPSAEAYVDAFAVVCLKRKEVSNAARGGVLLQSKPSPEAVPRVKRPLHRWYRQSCTSTSKVKVFCRTIEILDHLLQRMQY